MEDADETRILEESMQDEQIVWVPHPKDVWSLVQVVETDADGSVHVDPILGSEEDGSKRSFNVSKEDMENNSYPFEEIQVQVSTKDLCHLYTNLGVHEGPALHYMRQMFTKGIMYVDVNRVLVSLNPYKENILVTDPRKYCVDDDMLHEMPPHIYKMGNTVLNTLFQSNVANTELDKLNQSIILHGDAGSGKTENAKAMQSYLITRTDTLTPETNTVALERVKYLENVIKDATTVFEAFGNAKTTLNDNSSRFGKYVKLQYTDKNELVSVYTETFLLEKSRLVSVSPGERNYHIFYQIFRGMGSAYPELKSKLELRAVEEFKMLTTGNQLFMKNVQQDISGFHSSVKAMTAMGASPEELRALWTLLAVMLHLGNAVCTKASGEDQACKINIRTMPLDKVAQLLGVAPDFFLDSLVTLKMQSGGTPSRSGKMKETVVYLKEEEVMLNISGFLKHIYKGIFFWLVRKTNHCGAYHEDALGVPVKFAGVMDIFGFENKTAETNSLEQLCINFADENMKQQFNTRFFVFEQSVYESEGVKSDFIEFTDNTAIIDLIARKSSGLLTHLDGAEIGTDALVLSAMFKDSVNNDVQVNTPTARDRRQSAGVRMPLSPSKPPPQKSYNELASFGSGDTPSSTTFTVSHFAGQVTYNLSQFVSKNVENNAVDYTGLLMSSKNDFLKATLGIGSAVSEGAVGYIPWLNNPLVMPQAITGLKTKSIASSNSASSQFAGQLDTMMTSLRATSSYYVKCIKPNDVQSEDVFNAKLVNDQLRYHSVHEVITLTKIGYPERVEFRDFYTRFDMLKPPDAQDWKHPLDCNDEDCIQYSIEIAETLLESESFECGQSMIFLQDGCTEFLENTIMDFINANATLIQSHWRREMCQKSFKIKITKYRQKKAAAEFSKNMFDENGKLQLKNLGDDSLSHSIHLDVFSAIDRMQQRERTNNRRSTSPSNNLNNTENTNTNSLGSIFQIMEGEDDDDDDDDSGHIKKLHDYYISRIELIKNVIRNMLHRKRNKQIIEAVSNGDTEQVMNMLRRRPELIKTLDSTQDYCTLHHAALKGGSFEMLKLLGCSPKTVCIKDAGEHSAVHYAALDPNLDVYELMFRTLSSVVSVLPEVKQKVMPGPIGNIRDKVKAGVEEAKGGKLGTPKDKKSTVGFNLDLNLKGKSNESVVEEREPNFSKTDPYSGVNTHVKKSGFMYKLNNSGRLARRWFVLENQRLKYYYKVPDAMDKDYYVDEFKITRHDCFVSRYNVKGKENLFFVLNFSAPSSKKRRKKIIIKSNSEEELQKWLLNISQIASFDRFRHYAPRFRNPQLIRQWLSQLTWARESCLHTAVHAANSSLRKARKAALAEYGGLEMGGVDAVFNVDANKLSFESIKVVAWVIDMGANVNQKNHDGQTALHLAVECGNVPMALALVFKGAAVEIKDFKAATAQDNCDQIDPIQLGFPEQPTHIDLDSPNMKTSAMERRKTMEIQNAWVTINQRVTEMGRKLKQELRQESKEYHRAQLDLNTYRLLPSPITLNMGLRSPYRASTISNLTAAQKKGYSFLAMHVEKHGVELSVDPKFAEESKIDFENFKSAVHMGQDFMTLSIGVYNSSNHQLVEPVQEIYRAAYIDGSGTFVWWGCNYYMQTPLEFLPDGTYMSFRFYLKDVNVKEAQRQAREDANGDGINSIPMTPQNLDRTSNSGDTDDVSDAGSPSDFVRSGGIAPPKVELVDIDIAFASMIIDKATIDSGKVNIALKETREWGFRGMSDSNEEEKVLKSPVRTLYQFKPGGSGKSMLNLSFYLTEYFDPIPIKNIVQEKHVAHNSQFAAGSYLNNPPHLEGASHDKSQNKTKRGVVKPVPEMYALSYFEGAASERFEVTLPVHCKTGDVIKAVGGHKYIDIRMMGHISGGQSVKVVVPKFTHGPTPGYMEVYVIDYDADKDDTVKLMYNLPKGVTVGPYVVQNTDGSRQLTFSVSETMISHLAALEEHQPHLPIMLILNYNSITPLKVRSSQTKKGGEKEHAVNSVFASFLDAGGSNDNTRGRGSVGSSRSSVTGDGYETDSNSDIGVVYQENPLKTPVKSPQKR